MIGAPQASNSSGAAYLVYGGSGLAGKADVAAKSAQLLAAAKTHHLRPDGLVTLAQYNPPWTPWFMRRNEVMVPVEP